MRSLSHHLATRVRLAAALAAVLLPTYAASAVTYVVESASTEGDFDDNDGACATELGVCTWGALQGEIQGSQHNTFVVQFAPGVEAVPAGQLFAVSAGLNYDITIEGPITIDMSLPPARTRGLHFRDVDTIHLKNVWIKGTGSVDQGFDLADTGFVSTTLTPSSCIIESSSVTGVHTPIDLGTPTTPIHCDLLDNFIGIAPDGSLVGNGRGLVLYGSSWNLDGNVLAGSGAGFTVEIWDSFNSIKNNQFGAMGTVSFGNAGSIYVLGDNNTFENNVISNSGGRGMELRGDRNTVISNYFGTDSEGQLPMGNLGSGLYIVGHDNCIGAVSNLGGIPSSCNASSPEDLRMQANVVSDNGEDGVYVFGDRNELYESIVGTDATSDDPMANGQSGNAGQNGIFVNRTAADTLIQGGVVAGNLGSGISVEEAENTRISGVAIGTDSRGRSNLENEQHGIHLVSATGTRIGDLLDESAGNTIAGNFEDGIRIEGSNGTVSDVEIGFNWIGVVDTQASMGSGASVPNGGNGITIFNSVDGVEIRDNVISGNTGHGIQIRSAQEAFSSKTRNVDILHNYIGTSAPVGDPTMQPLEARGNGQAGIQLTDISPTFNRGAYGIQIGEPRTPADPNPGNIIAGNGGPGVWIDRNDDRAQDTVTLQGNYIGVDESMHAIPNLGAAGVLVGEFAALVLVGGENTLGTPASNVTYGISIPGNVLRGNVISGNLRDGVEVNSLVAVIQGNWIGTDAEGRIRGPTNEWLGLGNGLHGIDLSGGDIVLVGGTDDGGNVISGNGVHGIYLDSAEFVEITYNSIGIATPIPGFDQDVGNFGDGIQGIRSQTNEILFNSIGFNLSNGVHLVGSEAFDNWISENSIHDNSLEGIALTGGANNGINPPFDTTVTLAQVEGMTCPGCTVEVFSDSGDEGRIFEGAVVADGTGQFVYAKAFAGPIVSCTTFDASAVDSDRSTSKFGCQAAEPILLEALSIEKRVFDLDGDVVEPGERLVYQIDVVNQTVNDFEDIPLFDELKDIIPDGAEYVAESMTVDLVANDDDLADGIGFDAAANAIRWNGDIPSGGSLSIAFDIDVDSDAAAGTLISNRAQLIVGADTLPTLATALLSDDPDTLEVVDATDVIVGQPVPEPAAALAKLAALLVAAALRSRARRRA